jgi:hypothetical protein
LDAWFYQDHGQSGEQTTPNKEASPDSLNWIFDEAFLGDSMQVERAGTSEQRCMKGICNRAAIRLNH